LYFFRLKLPLAYNNQRKTRPRKNSKDPQEV
jgi:hypothetical protein